MRLMWIMHRVNHMEVVEMSFLINQTEISHDDDIVSIHLLLYTSFFMAKNNLFRFNTFRLPPLISAQCLLIFKFASLFLIKSLADRIEEEALHISQERWFDETQHNGAQRQTFMIRHADNDFVHDASMLARYSRTEIKFAKLLQ
jgi:hypothetical protein